jgi:glycerophosphoryl diester phosphodiesterase
MRKRKLRSFLYLLIWNVLLASITILLYLLVTLAAAASVVIWAKDSSALPLFLSILGKINTIMTAFLAVMCPIANFALVSAMYYRYKKETGEDVRVEVPPITDSEKMKKRMKKVFTLSVAVIISVNAFYFYSIVYNGLFGIEDALSPVKITSHRGNSVDAPENTLVALESAVDNLADYAEIDVQETKDGQIILLHDPNLKRTTGINKFIWELNYEEVAQLDAGSWFSDEYVGVKIPTFAEVLDYCKGKINLNVEIKNNGHSKDLEEKVVEIIKEYGFERQCVITSMNYESLVIVKKLNPDLKTGLIMPVVYGNFYDKQYSDFFSMKSNFITQRAISEAHSRGKEIHAWTVNTKNEMERLKNLGVDNIITDRPVAAREILYRSVANQTILGLLKSVLNQY